MTNLNMKNDSDNKTQSSVQRHVVRVMSYVILSITYEYETLSHKYMSTIEILAILVLVN